MDQKKEFTKYCNTLRCPLCKGQLDGGISAKLANLYCINNNDEYKCKINYGEEIPFVEQINYFYSQYRYEITIKKEAPHIFYTAIDRLNQDFNLFHIEKSRQRLFDYRGERILFFRTRMEEDVFLKKLKIYNLFS